jgi:hypothetical protein
LSDSDFEIGPLLEQLRARCGDAEFGYRMQALFAHVLMRQGCTILEIKAQGHPDIRARMGDRELLIQVKSTSHRTGNSGIELSSDDLAGVTAMGRRAGWFAMLDCAVPVKWIMLTSDRAGWLLGRPFHLATLQANSDVVMSTECNEHFNQIVAANRAHLQNLSYAVLRNRALAHNGL